MVLVGLVNLAERLLNQSDTQGQDTQLTQKTANSQAVQGAPGGVEDRFTPSTQDPQTHANAQDAGLFSVAQFSFFSAAADLFLRQTVGATTNPAPAAAPQAVPAVVVTPLAGLPQAANSANNSGISSNENGTNAAGGTTVGTIGAANAGGASAANNSAAANSLIAQQQQLQALNNSLVTLGLTPQQITQLDQIATIISDFNPTFFTALAYQLQELAQAQQALASATAGGAQTAAPNSATANVNGAPANAIGAGAVGGERRRFSDSRTGHPVHWNRSTGNSTRERNGRRANNASQRQRKHPGRGVQSSNRGSESDPGERQRTNRANSSARPSG